VRVSTVDTWLGPFTAIVADDGAVLASGWTADVAALAALIHPDLRDGELVPRRQLGPVSAAIRAYHAGDLAAPDAVPVRQYSGGEFLPAAWRALRAVPAGHPTTYADLARRSGNSTAIRAAASACARNAAALFVPCHRIMRTDGTLGGFRWGIEIKRRLLAYEAGTGRATEIAMDARNSVNLFPERKTGEQIVATTG
jgi:methylated-DNA-[protein]-cysteine S-methyltransferase